MCGIVGWKSERKIDKNIIMEMANTIAHRGPDGEGYAIFGNIEKNIYLPENVKFVSGNIAVRIIFNMLLCSNQKQVCSNCLVRSSYKEQV